MRDEIDRYERAGVQVLGINPAGVQSHARYVEKMGFPFPLLSDADRDVAGAYGALKPDGRGIQRSVVLVTRDGNVAFAERGAPGADRHLAPVETGHD